MKTLTLLTSMTALQHFWSFFSQKREHQNLFFFSVFVFSRDWKLESSTFLLTEERKSKPFFFFPAFVFNLVIFWKERESDKTFCFLAFVFNRCRMQFWTFFGHKREPKLFFSLVFVFDREWKFNTFDHSFDRREGIKTFFFFFSFCFQQRMKVDKFNTFGLSFDRSWQKRENQSSFFFPSFCSAENENSRLLVRRESTEDPFFFPTWKEPLCFLFENKTTLGCCGNQEMIL